MCVSCWHVCKGVLPPVNSSFGVSIDRSPYRVSLTDLVLRFSTSLERQKILDGFLRYRAALHGLGLTNGFQWLDGSFLEEVEMLEGRLPRDIDVVTFYDLPENQDQEILLGANADLFNPEKVKIDFLIDGYFVQRTGNNIDSLIEKATYWYSMWSHRRNQVWKGYLQVDLAPDEDETAKANLSETVHREAES